MYAFMITALLLCQPAFCLPSSAQRTSAPKDCITVGQGAQHATLDSAVKSLGSSDKAACIFVKSGTYKGQTEIKYRGALSIYGETKDTSNYKANTVTFENKLLSKDVGSLDKSATINIVSANFSMYNINVKNTAGPNGQAVAVSANANRLKFFGCQFIGFQDTLYVKNGQQYYEKCFMEGAVDYIFGAASAWFSECTISSVRGGAITASSRKEPEDPGWYVFDKCKVVGSSKPLNNKPLKNTVFLGRPWRKLARVMYQNSELTDVVHKEGWTKMAEGATPLYYEFNNKGAGANTSGRKFLSKKKEAVTKDMVLGKDWAEWTRPVW